MGFPIIPIGSSLVLGAYAKTRKQPVGCRFSCSSNATVDVVMPAKNEAKKIPFAIASLDLQTYPINKVFVFDDGSDDNTYDVAKSMSRLSKLDIEVIRREKSGGKTASLKQAARESKADKLFVLDADTVLVSDDYVEMMVSAQDNKTIASTFGAVAPIKRKEQLRKLLTMLWDSYPDVAPDMVRRKLQKPTLKDRISYAFLQWPVEKYREALYITDQYFMKDSMLRIFGTTHFPIGCAVLYDRPKLREVFDDYEESLGDNLTTSEDIFLGFAFCDRGYENIQVRDAFVMSVEPKINRLLHQLFLWTSSFVQSAYYFKNLTFAFGTKRSSSNVPKQYRTIGYSILFPIVEKVTFPLMLIILYWLNPILALMTLGLEFVMYFAISLAYAPSGSRERILPGLFISSMIRLAHLPLDLYVVTKFAFDVFRGKREWKK